MRPTRSQALQIIAGAPAGLTSAQLATRLKTSPAVASDLARHAAAAGLVRSAALPGNRKAKLWLVLS